jgi:hypothetical protein
MQELIAFNLLNMSIIRSNIFLKFSIYTWKLQYRREQVQKREYLGIPLST